MRKALFILCVLVAAGSCAYVCLWLLGGWRQKHADRALAALFTPPAQARGSAAAPDGDGAAGEDDAAREGGAFDELASINPDAVGWLKIEGTAIDYPVVQRGDNEYYLTHDFYMEPNRHGAIFMDYRCTRDGGRIIYGHRMKDGTMFRELERFKDEAFLNAHGHIRLYDLAGAFEDYRISGVLDWKEPAAPEEPSLYAYLTQLASESPQNNVLFLVTCESGDDDARLVVTACAEPAPD